MCKMYVNNILININNFTCCYKILFTGRLVHKIFNTIRELWFVVQVTFCFLFLIPAASQADEIVVGGTSYWNPYCYASESDPLQLNGFTVDIVRHIFSAEDDELKLLALPWKRCLHRLEHGDIDLVLDASINSPKLHHFIFSDQFYEIDSVFFYNTDKFSKPPKINTAADVDNYKLGGLRFLNYKIYPFDVSEVEAGAPDHRALLTLLRRGRFDLAIGFKQVVISHAKMKNLDMHAISWIPMPGVAPLSFRIIGNNTERGRALIKRINEGLAEMKKSGELRELKVKYGLFKVDS